MKKYITTTFIALITIPLIAIWIVLSSSSGGRNDNRTGSPGSAGTCASCHGSGTNPGGLTVTGFPTNYTPGTTYSITLNIDNSTASNGFQATIQDGAGNPAGNFTAGTGSNVQGATGDLIGHGSPSLTGSWTFDWTAPSSSTGQLTMYAVGNAVDGIGPSPGDSVYTAQFISNEAALLSATVTTQSPTCYQGCDGTAEATASDGTPPYAFNWSAGNTVPGSPSEVTDLCAGTYQVTVEDAAGDSIVESFTINNPDSMEVQAQITHTACVDSAGEISLTVSGGISPYSYSWSTGDSGSILQNVYPGTYQVDVADDSNCIKTVSFEVQDTASGITADFNITEPGCGDSDGTATIVLTPAGNYDISWSTGDTGETATGLSAGNYEVTVTDTVLGCQDSFTVNMPNLNAPDITDAQVQEVDCYGDSTGSISLTVQGNDPFQYQWSEPEASGSEPDGLSAGTYEVTITDSAGCEAFGSYEIEQPGEPFSATVSVTPDTNEQCIGAAELSVSGNNAQDGLTFNWPDGEFGSDRDELCEGTYEVTVTDNNGCDTIVVVEIENVTTNFVAEREQTEVRLFPNPSNGNFTVYVDKNAVYQIYSYSGSLIRSGRLDKGENRLQLDSPKGIYLIKLYNNSGFETVKRLSIVN